MPLARKLAAVCKKSMAAMRLHLPRGLWLAAADVEELLKVKAAFALALDALLRAARVPPRELAALCLAGALGEHVRADNLEQLGFVPSGLQLPHPGCGQCLSGRRGPAGPASGQRR